MIKMLLLSAFATFIAAFFMGYASCILYERRQFVLSISWGLGAFAAFTIGLLLITIGRVA
jgi:hypothetical protein